MAKIHEKFKPWEHLHNPVGSFDGGSCVDPHEPSYKQRDSCSYRWQAHHRAMGPDRSLYGSLRRTKKQPMISYPRVKTAGDYVRNRVLAMAPGPVTSTASGDRQLVTGLPFRTAFAPWANNAHHLLPDAELRNGIFGLTDKFPKVHDMVIQDLHKHKYNLNHWKNMMILPQEVEQGCALELPTHPAGDSHPAYSAVVTNGVDTALAPYKAVVKQLEAGKPHDVPDGLNVVTALQTLSDSLHAAVLAQKPLVKARCLAGQDISLASFSPQIAAAPGV